MLVFIVKMGDEMMWSIELRSILMVAIPFTFILMGGVYRRNRDNNELNRKGRQIQVLGIALLAVLIVGDFITTNQDSMRPFIIALIVSGLLIILFYFLTITKKKKPVK